MRFLFVVHKNEEKAEQNSVLFHRLTLKERGLRPNGYFPLMRQPHLALPGYPEGGPTIEFFTWEISDGTPANKINGGGMGHIAIAVDDVEAVYRKVEANGGSACGEIARHYYETKDQTLTLVYAKDPDGNVIEIQRWDDGDITK